MKKLHMARGDRMGTTFCGLAWMGVDVSARGTLVVVLDAVDDWPAVQCKNCLKLSPTNVEFIVKEFGRARRWLGLGAG